jgi:hypothetical protein
MIGYITTQSAVAAATATATKTMMRAWREQEKTTKKYTKYSGRKMGFH